MVTGGLGRVEEAGRDLSLEPWRQFEVGAAAVDRDEQFGSRQTPLVQHQAEDEVRRRAVRQPHERRPVRIRSVKVDRAVGVGRLHPNKKKKNQPKWISLSTSLFFSSTALKRNAVEPVPTTLSKLISLVLFFFFFFRENKSGALTEAIVSCDGRHGVSAPDGKWWRCWFQWRPRLSPHWQTASSAASATKRQHSSFSSRRYSAPLSFIVRRSFFFPQSHSRAPDTSPPSGRSFDNDVRTFFLISHACHRFISRPRFFYRLSFLGGACPSSLS